MPDSHPLSFIRLSVAELLNEFRAGKRSPEQTVTAIYESIRRSGDDHVWIHLAPEEDSVARARELEKLSRDLPLFGVPFAVKDNFDVAGMPTTAGCPAFSYEAETSAAVVAKVLAAGAILIGKTNMDQFATGLVGTRSPYGACSSVYDPEYISGGSSSGSAVAVAKGFVAFAFGTDTAGSGRVPAAFNGIVGLKPTRGLVSAAGVVPACRSLDCVSVFAADVEGAGRVLEAIVGEDPADVYSRTGSQVASAGSGMTLGVPRGDQMQFFSDDKAAKSWADALAKAERLGAKLVEFDIDPFLEAAELLYAGPFVAERYAAVGEFVQSHPEEDIDPTVRQIILDSARYSAIDTFRAEYKLQRLKSLTSKVVTSVDALLLPTAPTTYKIQDVKNNPVQLNSRLGTYTNFVNLLDLSGIAVPAGFRSDGLPFGVTFLSVAFGDRRSLEIAHWWDGSVAPKYKIGEDERVLLAVVGAHLTGQPLNWQLTSRNAKLIRSTTTSAKYRLYALKNTVPAKPGLVRTTDLQEHGIEIEVWQLTRGAFGSFVAEIPPPLGIGTLELSDGSMVKGFLCEPYAIDGSDEITYLGGWRRYLETQTVTAC